MDNTMLTKQEIIDLASRYTVPAEITDFPCENDLFCFLHRDILKISVPDDDKGWEFQGYGQCLGYTADDEEKPAGKWLWMHYVSLATFPPSVQVVKLQPPHVVKGRYQTPDRQSEIRIVKIILNKDAPATDDPDTKELGEGDEKPVEGMAEKIVPFRRKKT
jgi:hypothetical protein